MNYKVSLLYNDTDRSKLFIINLTQFPPWRKAFNFVVKSLIIDDQPSLSIKEWNWLGKSILNLIQLSRLKKAFD